METCTDAERVARRRDLTLNDAKLCVNLLRPGRPPTFVTTGDVMYLSNTFLFIDLPHGVDIDRLWQYAEKAAGTPVDKITFSCTNPSAALVKYTADPGTDGILSFSH